MQDILLEYLKVQKEIIIYGAGANGRFLKSFLDIHKVKVHFFCDSNNALWGKSIDGTECISPRKLDEHTYAVMIVSPLKNDEIRETLRQFHFTKILYWNDVKFLRKQTENRNQVLKDKLVREPVLKRLLERNKRFKDIHKGKRCFIIGNGPSLRKENLSVLADEITFTVNQIANSPQFQDIHTNYHLWADPRFFKVKAQCEGDYALLEMVKNMPDDAEYFFRYDCMHEYVETFGIDNDINVNYYAVNSLVNEEMEIDFSGFIQEAWTVVQYAIRLSVYMWFQEIYLLGCDCTGIMNAISARLSSYESYSHCYDIDERERERERLMFMERPFKVYYQAEIGGMEGYHSLNKYCRMRDIAIYNCTQGGLLDEFPRRSLKDVIGN